MELISTLKAVKQIVALQIKAARKFTFAFIEIDSCTCLKNLMNLLLLQGQD